MLILISSVVAILRHVSIGEIWETNQEQNSLMAPAYRDFEQPRDHFNPRDTNTWLQRYYVDDTFYKPGGPVFLKLIGEWEISNKNVESALEHALAQRYNGLHIAIQHRYYGSNHSLPVADFTTENLYFLTESQALADAANFIIQYGKSLPTGTKWIATGGSYAGSLAAWLRYKYPDLVFAAHSSSAPVLAKPDFFEFEEAVNEGFVAAGGNEKCKQGWINAVEAFDYFAQKDEIWVKQQFGSPVDMDIRDLAGITTIFSKLIQYGEKSSQKVTIKGSEMYYHKAICEGNFFPAFTDPGASREQLFQDLVASIKLVYPTPDDYLRAFDSPYGASKNLGVLWSYQFCNHYGYFQTSNPRPGSKTMFSKLITTDYYNWFCKVYFGNTYTSPNAASINSKYRGLDIVNNINNIVFVNSNLDPWRKLGVYSNTPRYRYNSNIIIEIPNAYHCSDMQIPKSTDPQELKTAHQQILEAWDKLLT